MPSFYRGIQYQGLKVYYPLPSLYVLHENVQVRDKTLAGLRQFAKDKIMHIGLSQMEARISESYISPEVDLHHQCCFEQSGPKGKGKTTETAI